MNNPLQKSKQIYKFPPTFLWGAATASHQVEGGNRWNDWWAYEQAGLLPYQSGEACRHYDLYEQDFEMARSWGHNAHRFSIEWSRIEPEEGQWNADALAHYDNVLKALSQKGLEPVVTLHHFTNPHWFLRNGGWESGESVRRFAHYVRFLVEHLKEDVKYWITINEPLVYVKQAYILGAWPPCSRKSWIKAIKVFNNLGRAHVAAYQILHEKRQNIVVGFSHSAPYIVPCRPESLLNCLVVWVRDLVLNRSFFIWVKAVSKRHLKEKPPFDFIGINYYARTIIRAGRRGYGLLVGEECRLDHHEDRGPASAVGWEIYPAGLLGTLERFSAYHVPLLVTENGIATDDEELRRWFLYEHIKAIEQALKRGLPVIGYLYWTLMDNFEWAQGTTIRYGLASVDFDSQERMARPCVADFKLICQSGCLSIRSLD